MIIVSAKEIRTVPSPSSSRETSAAFDAANMDSGTTRVTANTAFMSGSSKHGNARRAYVDSNCVTARWRSAPSTSNVDRYRPTSASQYGPVKSASMVAGPAGTTWSRRSSTRSVSASVTTSGSWAEPLAAVTVTVPRVRSSELRRIRSVGSTTSTAIATRPEKVGRSGSTTSSRS